MSWIDRAQCAGMDLDLFFPVGREPVSPAAVAACNDCPVTAQCHQDAETWGDAYGYRAGVLREELRYQRRRKRQPEQDEESAA